jgi:hypothetical protein
MATDIFTEHDGMIAVNLDGGEVESPDEFYAGNRVTKEGHYHVNATDCTLSREDGKLPTLKIDLQILDGTDPNGKRLEDQIDKLIVHRIFLARWEDKANGIEKPLDDRAQKGIRAFAFAFGLIAESDLSKKNVNIPFHMIVGRQAIVKVQREADWEDKDGKPQKGSLKISWNNDAWPVHHDFVKDVHKNREALALIANAGDGVGAVASDDDLNDI